MLGNPNYAVWTDEHVGASARTRERDGFTCGHCQLIVLVRPRPTLFGHLLRGDQAHCNDANEIDHADVRKCPACQRFVCGGCAAQKRCFPWEEMLKKMESRDRMLRSIIEPVKTTGDLNTIEYLEQRDQKLAELEMERRKASAQRSVG